MKKNNRSLTGIGCLLAGAIWLLPACSVRKQQHVSMRQRQEMARIDTDGLSFTSKREKNGESIRQWETIRLSAPDSNGRQHITAVAHSRTVRNLHTTGQDSLQRYSHRDIRQKDEAEAEKKADTQRRPPAGWKWCVGIGIIILMIRRFSKYL